MKKSTAILAFLLLTVMWNMPRSHAYSFQWIPPYDCYSTMMGFNLIAAGQNVYRLNGPIYVPLPGYSVSLSPLKYSFRSSADAEATLTLIPPPSNIMNKYDLPRLAVVPPLWIDIGFVADVPLRKLTIIIDSPVDHFNKHITCLLTGYTQ
jgi:hypothetical protein